MVFKNITIGSLVYRIYKDVFNEFEVISLLPSDTNGNILITLNDPIFTTIDVPGEECIYCDQKGTVYFLDLEKYVDNLFKRYGKK